MAHRHQTLRRITDIHDPQPEKVLVVFRTAAGKKHKLFIHDPEEWDALYMRTDISLERVVLVKS